MKKDKNTMTVVQDEIEVPSNVVTLEMVEDVKKQLDELIATNKVKVYGLDVKTQDTVTNILEYLEYDVEWTHMEAFGIPKVIAAISKEKIKNGCIYLKGLEVEALTFYLSKAKGKGLVSANKFLSMQNAIESSYTLRTQDNKEVMNTQMKYESLKEAYDQGIAVAQEVAQEEV